MVRWILRDYDRSIRFERPRFIHVEASDVSQRGGIEEAVWPPRSKDLRPPDAVEFERHDLDLFRHAQVFDLIDDSPLEITIVTVVLEFNKYLRAISSEFERLSKSGRARAREGRVEPGPDI